MTICLRTISAAARGSLAAILLAVILLARPGAACASTDTPTFTEGRCSATDPDAEIARRIRCGTVSVPRDYARPERGSFTLAVVVIASARQPARPEPDLYVSGGPGGPLTIFAGAQARRSLSPDREQILVDQRGTGGSEPAICPTLDRDLVAAVAVDPASADRRRAVYAACRDRALAAGLDLADFGTRVSVEDLDRVRQALGVARWNVFGVSYGTTVAMTMMALHPETVRSAVLDSVYPPDPILPPWSANAADARDAFLAACEREAACRSAFPDLPELYRAAAASLAAEPRTIAVPHDMGRPGDQVSLTPALFAFVVDRLVYYPTFYPGLPRLVAAARDGDFGPVAEAVRSLFKDETNPATGARLSLRAAVDCRDRPRYHGAPSPAEAADMTTLSGICDAWTMLGPPPLVPSDTSVPTLVLAGEFDPNARPPDSRRVAGMLGTRARWIEFAGMGHSVRAFSPCAAQLVATFFEDPERPLDASCAARAPVIRVLPRFPAAAEPSEARPQ